MSILMDAINTIAKLTTGRDGAEGKVVVKDFDNNQWMIVKPDGSYELKEKLVDYDDVAVSSIEGVVGFVNSLPLQGGIIVSVCEDSICVEVDGNQELNQSAIQVRVEICKTYVLKKLDFVRERPQFMSPQDMIRFLRTSPFYPLIDNITGILKALDEITWSSTTSGSTSGVGTSRASYGKDILEKAEPRGEQKLADFVVKHVKYFDDRAVPVSADIRCFWEFDVSNQMVMMVPYGGQIDPLRTRAYMAIEDFLIENISEVQEGRVTVLRYRL